MGKVEVSVSPFKLSSRWLRTRSSIPSCWSTTPDLWVFKSSEIWPLQSTSSVTIRSQISVHYFHVSLLFLKGECDYYFCVCLCMCFPKGTWSEQWAVESNLVSVQFHHSCRGRSALFPAADDWWVYHGNLHLFFSGGLFKKENLSRLVLRWLAVPSSICSFPAGWPIELWNFHQTVPPCPPQSVCGQLCSHCGPQRWHCPSICFPGKQRVSLLNIEVSV